MGELLDAVAHAGEGQAECRAVFNKRDELVELAAGVGAGEGDADGIVELLALDAGCRHDLIQPGFEVFRGYIFMVGAGQGGQLAEHGAGGGSGQEGGILSVALGRAGVEVKDG